MLMSLVQNIYRTILDALFPLSPAERELFSYSPEKAYLELPRSSAPSVPNTSSIYSYKDERVAKLIWNIKYKKSTQAIKMAGYALHEAHPVGDYTESSRSPIVLIPMPITAQRRRERGFNQCELLVEEMKRLDTTGQFTINSNLLIRTQHTSRQTLKARSERLKDAKGIFSVKIEAHPVGDSAESPRGATSIILVIDDVITTGSTMQEALETLRKAGFKDVRGLSVAH